MLTLAKGISDKRKTFLKKQARKAAEAPEYRVATQSGQTFAFGAGHSKLAGKWLQRQLAFVYISAIKKEKYPQKQDFTKTNQGVFFMGVHVMDEAERCLNCKKPMCQQGCPVHTSIPQVIQAFRENRLADAGNKLFENNPLSVVCSIVCNHEKQCEGHCVLGTKGIPIHFSSIENFISVAWLERREAPVAEKKGIRAAVIGSGPAGITVAVELAKHGFDVTVFEARDKIGGMMQYGIPDFRLPRSILTRYKKKMLDLGIQIRPNTTIGGALTIEELFRDGYAGVFVGTGVWRPKTLGIHGETLANVHFGIDYLANPDAYSLGERVAVIGTGNVAMDVARTALRRGAREVTLYAVGKAVTASSSEMSYAMLEGAEVVYGKAIASITPQGPVFKTAVFDEKDEIVGYEPEEEQVDADATIICISQGPKNKLILTTAGLQGSDEGLLITNDRHMTTREGVFAAGDVVHGPKTVVHAVEEAKKAAAAMMDYMEKKHA